MNDINLDLNTVEGRLTNFMRGLYEEICTGEETYTSSEIYNMLDEEVFLHEMVVNNLWEKIYENK